MVYDTIIIGGGTAGLACALYSARFSLKTLVIAKEYGGTGNIAHLVDNWIGDPGISGLDLMQKFISHVKEYKVQMEEAVVTSVKKKGKNFVVQAGKKKYETKTVVFANGMRHRNLNVPGEKEFTSNGVHYCYTCDGPLYGGSTVAVVGGSDSAGLGALFMADYAKKVYVIYRKDKLRAEPVTAKKVYSHKKIEVIHNANIKEIYGDKAVKGVKLDNSKDLKLDGIFIEIGHVPISELVKDLGVKLDNSRFIKVEKDQSTNIPGIFAAGDLTDASKLKQFITSAAEGSIAAQSIYFYINSK